MNIKDIIVENGDADDIFAPSERSLRSLNQATFQQRIPAMIRSAYAALDAQTGWFPVHLARDIGQCASELYQDTEVYTLADQMIRQDIMPVIGNILHGLDAEAMQHQDNLGDAIADDVERIQSNSELGAHIAALDEQEQITPDEYYECYHAIERHISDLLIRVIHQAFVSTKITDVAESTANDVTKLFTNVYDPAYANLQRVALLAMQGRQPEAAGLLQRVIKDADPAVQKKIVDAVNSIKPVTINGRVADSSTLDKSKSHQDWILNTFIPWVQSLLGQQGVAEAFDNPYKTKTEKSEYGDVDVLAKLPDGTNLSIMFNHEGDNEWQVEFYRDNSQEVTGQGDAQRIFATVLAAIQKFVKKYQPDVIKFSAEKSNNSDSRSSLYDRLVSRFAQQLGYNDYSEEYMSSTMYELSKQSQGVAENNHWHAAGVADARRDVKRNPNRKVKTLNPRTQLKTMQDKRARHPEEVEQYSLGYRSINPALNEDAVMGKIEQSGQIVRILKKQHTVPFSSDKDWLLIDTDPAKGNKGLGIKWVPANTRFEWVRSYKDTLNQEVAESNVFTDARMNAIKAGQDTFVVHGKTYQVTGDTTDELEAGITENFIDGRHPEDKGDSKRHGINTRAGVSSLRKTAKQGGRKGQLAHWLANMKAGRAKANKK